MRPRGFVLVLVLALLVVLTSLAGTVALVVDRARADALARQARLESDVAAASTRATVMFLLSTQRMTFGGLTVDASPRGRPQPAGLDLDALPGPVPVGNEIRMDGTPYTGVADAVFALRDDRGRLAVNWSPPAWLEALVARSVAGGEAPSYVVLRDLLLDYQDPDDAYRVNGAERSAYLEAGIPPPPNRTLASALELRRVLGWREALAERSDRELIAALTTARAPLLNINTAPVEVLEALPGIDALLAARIVAHRELQPFVSLYAFQEMVGQAADDNMPLTMFPGDSGTLEIHPTGGGPVSVLHWTLTPWDDGGRPWREDYEVVVPIDPLVAGRSPVAPATEVFAHAATASQ